MFKIESYITPLLLNVVEKYVKNLKAEDTQVSLWGGDAVFSNLDLRTDVLERELHLPLRFINGHIHELRIHVPWHKLTSEPIVVTIDTMECVMRLPSDSERLDFSDTSSSSSLSRQQSNRQKKQPETDEVPPGYIQTLVKKVTNNLSVVCNNLILKYVEDDIVLSINVRTVSSCSADHTWTPAFTDFVPPLLFLRKLVKFTDFTVCLDRRSASGKIESYQEPLLYRCSLEARFLQQFSGLHATAADVTRCDVLCPQLEFSITDVQVPMLLRLMELTRALLFGELATDRPPGTSDEDNADAANGGGAAEDGSGPGPGAGSGGSWSEWAWSVVPSPMSMLPICHRAVTPPLKCTPLKAYGGGAAEDGSVSGPGAGSGGSWSEWAWSVVPSPMSMLPITWDEEQDDDDAGARLAAHERVIHLAVYVQQVEAVFKMSESVRGSASARRSARFVPYLRVSAAGALLSSVVRGVQAVSSSWGVSHLALRPCGGCTCRHHPGTERPPEISYLQLGRSGEAYMAGSLFAPPPPRPTDTRQQYNIHWDTHMREKTESWLLERTPAMAADYLYQLDLPEDFSAEDEEMAHMLTDLQYSNLPERSMFRVVVGPSQILVTSGSVHRLGHLLTAAGSVTYPPYSQPPPPDGEVTGTGAARDASLADELAALEANTPSRGLQLTVLEPRVTVVAGHSDQHRPGAVQLQLRCQTIQWNEQQPMYPARLCRCVSQLRRPPATLLYSCHVHTRCTLTAGQAVLAPAGHEDGHGGGGGGAGRQYQVGSVSSASVYWKSLLVPRLWTGARHPPPPLAEHVWHVDWLRCELSARQGGQLLHLYRTLLTPSRPDQSTATDAALAAAPTDGLKPDVPLETDVSGLDVRLCQTGWCWAVSASLTALRCHLDGRPVVVAPQTADAGGSGGGERAVRALLQLPTEAAAGDSCPLLVVVSEPALLCWQPTLLLWLSLVTDLLAGQPAPPPSPPPALPSPVPPPAEDRASSRTSGRRSPAVDVPRPHGHARTLRSSRSLTTERTTPTTAATIPTAPQPQQQQSQPLAWLSALERLEVRLHISPVTITVPAESDSSSGGGGLGDTGGRSSEPAVTTPATVPGAPVPGRVRSSSDAGRQYCLPAGQLVSVLPAVRLDSAVLKGAALPAVPEMPVQLSRPAAPATGRPAAPWQACLSGAEAYVQLEGGQRCALMAPARLECTVGLGAPTASGTASGTTGTTDSGTDAGTAPLSLVVHANMAELQLTMGQRQIQALAVVVDQCLAAMDCLAPLMASAAGPVPTVDDSKPSDVARGAMSQSEDQTTSGARRPADHGQLTSDSSAVGAPVSRSSDRPAGPCVSVWLQWTLPRVSLLLVGPPGTDRLLTVMEDLAVSVDSQAVYTKAKLNLASLETSRQPARTTSCSSDRSASPRSDASQVIFTSSRRLTRALVVTCRDRAASPEPEETGETEQRPAPRQRALLSMVCTRALRSNVLQKWGSSAATAAAATGSGGGGGGRYVTELELRLKPCDLVLTPDTLLPYSGLLEPLLTPLLARQTRSPAPQTAAIPPPPPAASSDLPLLYVSCEPLRLFLPSGDDQLLLLQLGQLRVQPAADFPLSRPVLRPDLCPPAGAAPDLDDRHYQAEVRGVLAATGSWREVLAQSEREQPPAGQTLATMGENPAVQWNNLAALPSAAAGAREVALTPVLEPCDVRVTLAPAITAAPGAGGGPALLLAGHAAEVNVTTPLTLALSRRQALLLRQLADNAALALRKLLGPAPVAAARPAARRPAFGGVPPSPAAADSGIGSGRAEPPPPADAAVPFEALLTLADVTVTLYDHEDLPPPSEDNITPPDVAPQDGAPPPPCRPVPLLYVSAAQPHAFLAFGASERRLQLSVFDLSVRAGEPGGRAEERRGQMPVEDEQSIPGRVHFPLTLLETRPGEPHPKTGIPPSLLTATLADSGAATGAGSGAAGSAAELTVDIGRPLKLCWVEAAVRQLVRLGEAAESVLWLPQTPDTGPAETATLTAAAAAVEAAAAGDPWLELGDQARQWAAAVSAVTVSSGQLVFELQPESDGARLRAALCGLSGAVRCQTSPGEPPAVLTADVSLTDLSVSCQLPAAPWRPLLQPWSPTLTAELQWEPWSPRPYCRVYVTSDALVLDLGAEQLACVETLMKLHPTPLPDTAQGDVIDSAQINTNISSKSGACLGISAALDSELGALRTRSEDDLRRGHMVFSQGDHATCPVGHVSFDKCAGVMSWRYAQPRVLSAVHVYPVPFVAGSEVSHVSSAAPETAEVTCLLQYYDRLRRRFCTLCQFQLSESQTSRLLLPIPVETSKSPSAALWRVQICLPEGEPPGRLAVCPTALAACLRVDSEFRPACEARLRAAAELGGVQTRLWLQAPTVGGGRGELPSPLAGYRLQPGWPSEHVFASVALDGAAAAASLWPDMLRLQADGALSVTAVEYACLTEAPLLEPALIRLDAVRSTPSPSGSSSGGGGARLELLAATGPATLRVSPGAVHTLTAAAADWETALLRHRHHAAASTTDHQLKDAVKDNRLHLLPARYVIRNNTGCRLWLGQAGTEQADPLLQQHAALHCWMDRRRPPLLRLGLKDQDAWSRPLSLETDGEQVALLPAGPDTPTAETNGAHTTTTPATAAKDGQVTYPVIVTVEPLSATQKLVTVDGRLKVVNALDVAVWADVRTAPSPQLLSVPPRACSASVVCGTASGVVSGAAGGAVRLQVAAATDGAAAVYRDVELNTSGGGGGAEPTLLALGPTHAWCAVLHESVGPAAAAVTRTLVVLSPVFCARSLLPAPLELRQAGGGHTHQLAGRGAVQSLSCDPSAVHQLTMKLSAGAEWSSPPVALSVGALEEATDPPPPVPRLPELARVLTSGERDWLPGGDGLDAVDQPDVQLEVRVCRRWPWLSTLLLDVRPGLLVTNECGEPLLLRCGSRDAPPALLPPAGVLAAPSAPGGPLYVSALVGEEEFPASRLVLGDQQWPYQRPPPGGQSVLPPDGAVPMAAYVRQQVALFSVSSRLRAGLRHVTIRPRVVAVNETGRHLPLAALAAGGAAPARGARLPEVHGRYLSASDARPQPLLWWQLADGIAPDPAAAPLPLRLLLDLSGCRQRPLQLPDGRGSRQLHGPGRRPDGRCLNSLLRLAHTQRDGQTFVSVREETAPFLLVTNDTPLPVTVLQPEPAEPVEEFVTAGAAGEVPAGRSLYLPEPEGGPGAEQAHYRLQLAVGPAPGTEGTPDAAPATGRVTAGAERATVDLTYDNTQFLHVSGHDLTAHVRVRGHTHHVQLRPVSRLEVCARDVRARLARDVGGRTGEKAQPPQPPTPRPAKEASPPLPVPEEKETDLESGVSVQLTAVCDQLSVVLQDTWCAAGAGAGDAPRTQEVLRLTADRLAVLLCPPPAPGAPSLLSACVADVQLDSQLPPTAGQLYQVLLAAQQQPGHQHDLPPLSALPPLELSAALNSLRRSALLLLELGLEPDAAAAGRLRSLRLQARPLRLFVEDRCQAAYTAYVRRLLSAAGGGSAEEEARALSDSTGGVCTEVRAELAALSGRVLADQLTIEPLSLTLSVRAHRQLYLSIDDSPLQLPAFQRVGVRTSLERLLDELVRHYMWSAIYKAGGVVASLDLLGDPAGLARSLTQGVRDLVQLPYRGLLTGPAGLVTGCGRGLASLASHLAAGAVSSVSGLAAALAHNLHRLSLDADHLARAEQRLGDEPAGLAHGLRQGLTGLGLALLGAVAGLADQPLQGAIEGRSAGALVGGLGRGLVGALTKPLGGAADLLAHTGQGLLHSAGWRRRPARRHPDCGEEAARAALAPLWYAVRLSADAPVLAVAEATRVVVTARRPPAYTAVTVVLTGFELRLLAETDTPGSGEPVVCTAVYDLTETDLVSSEWDPTEVTVRRRPGHTTVALAESPAVAPEQRHAEATHAYVAEYVRGNGGGGGGGVQAEGAALATLLLSAERRPLLVAACRAAQRRLRGAGFPLS